MPDAMLPTTRGIILASTSETRLMLLRRAGIDAEAVASGVNEAPLLAAARREGLDAPAAALRLAEAKTRAVAQRRIASVVIGADQIAVCEGRWFGKPGARDALRDQLAALRGRTHELATAVVCAIDGVPRWRHVAMPRLTMRDMSEAFIDLYMAADAGRSQSSAGGYRIEELGAHLLDAVEGEHSAILGLPMLPLLAFLREAGIVPS